MRGRAQGTHIVTILTVGQGQQYATIAAAVAASRDGDVVQIQAGTYVNDFATIGTKITLQGVGGMAKLIATVPPPNGKGILVTTTDVTLDSLELTGAKVADRNGAGVRYEGGNLVIINSYVHDNEDGLLANSAPTGSITIRNSEFANNGGAEGYSHNLYVNRIASLTIEDSYIHGAVAGHQIKSRADVTTITGSRIYDDDGNGSYSIDLPNGGKAILANNVIQQGANSNNPAIVHFGGEGPAYPGSSLEISDTTVINQLGSASARLLLNQTGVTVGIRNVDVFGLAAGEIASGPASVRDVTYLPAAPPLDTSAPWAATSPGGLSLTGTAAADALTGGAGNDTITGGGGWDALVGGAGADRFVYANRTDRLDHILDFNAAEGDVVDLAGVFAATPHPDDMASLIAQGFVQLWQREAGVRLSVDLDGGGNAFRGLLWLDGETIASLGDRMLIA